MYIKPGSLMTLVTQSLNVSFWNEDTMSCGHCSVVWLNARAKNYFEKKHKKKSLRKECTMNISRL